MLQLTGPGYVYEPSVCRFPSGGTARLSVDVALKGTGTFGCIVRGPRGVEKANVCKPLRAGATFEAQSIRVDAAAGDTLEPYVFAWGPKCTARIRSFSMVLIPNAQVP
ncbi:MAG: hypothetical protein HZA53_12890 [Planctomycetes bacterium]|nr:hypothetical protein [Planctomycetota bacterium]